MRLANIVEHDIAGLEIPVDHTVLVGVLNGFGQLGHQCCRFLGCWPLAGKPVGECYAPHIVADNEELAVRLAHFMDRDDARMMEAGSRARLTEKALRFVGAEVGLCAAT